MSEIETAIQRHSLQRIASIFNVDIHSLPPSARFGEDLKARRVADFKANEFDIIDRDIKDVADKPLLRAMSRGDLEIRTVGDYCDHMVRCYLTRPKDVALLLSLPQGS